MAEKLNSEILKTKHHFEVLDGLRGVAAIAVVTFHFMEVVISDYAKNFIGHGFLAVDFFFCLSGFVIAYAYDDRIGKIGLAQFFKARLIRLHPLVVLGSVMGLILFLFDPFTGVPADYTVGRIALLFLCSILMIPIGGMPDRALNLFGFNAPAWSLFWEYIANIVYAFVLCRLKRAYLIVLLLVSAMWLTYVAFHAQNLMGGWGTPTFWNGAARVSYSFTAGMLIHRFNLKIKNKLGFIGLAILLLAALTMPYFKLNWLVELLVVLFYFPLLIMLGAGTVVSDNVKKLCNFSGNLSYPLYMTHYFVIWMFAHYLTSRKLGNTELTFVVIGGVICLIGVGYLAMVFYDIPVRKWLNKKGKVEITVEK